MDAISLSETFSALARCLSNFQAIIARYEEWGDDGDEENAFEDCVDCIHQIIARLQELHSKFYAEGIYRSDRELWSKRLVRYASEDLRGISELIVDLGQAVGLLRIAKEKGQLTERATKVGYEVSVLAAIGFAKDALASHETRFAALGRLYSRTDSPDEIVPGEDSEIDSAIAFYDYFRPQDILSLAPAPEEGAPIKTQVAKKGARPFGPPSWLVPVFFATDREKTGESHPLRLQFSNGRRIGDLAYGIAEVSIPRGHKRGKIERPSLWKLQFREDLDKHVVITSCEEKALSEWKLLAQQRIEDAGESTALVFIHGYNVAFNDAIRNAGQIGWDLNVSGLIIAFSWCSEGEVLNYLADESSARLCVPKLTAFLTFLRDSIGLKSINIIAHSMGNLLLVEALRKIKRDDGALVAEEVVFAAPDYDADEFRAAVGDLSGKARRYTLYGSDRDRALALSKKMRKGYPRAGDGGANVLVIAGVETVDASLVGEDLLGLGHSYFSSRRTLLSDLNYVIKESLPPWRRDGLSEVNAGLLKYWVFKP